METTSSSFGFAHLLAQSDAVGKTLLACLIVMSVASWALIVLKGIAQWQRTRRGQAFLNLFWNASSWTRCRRAGDPRRARSLRPSDRTRAAFQAHHERHHG